MDRRDHSGRPEAYLSWGDREAFHTGFPQGLTWQKSCSGGSEGSIAAGVGAHAQRPPLGMFPISVIFKDSVLQLLKVPGWALLPLDTCAGLNKLFLNEAWNSVPAPSAWWGRSSTSAAHRMPRKWGLADGLVLL